MQDGLIETLPFVISGGVLLWLLVFLGTYSHFPKMVRHKRLEFSIINATSMAIALMVILYLAMGFLNRLLLR